MKVWRLGGVGKLKRSLRHGVLESCTCEPGGAVALALIRGWGRSWAKEWGSGNGL